MSIKNGQEKRNPSIHNGDIVIIPRRRGRGMTISELYKLFPAEKDAINYFFNIRYKDGFICPHCWASVGVYRYRHRDKVCHCHSCNNSFSPFTGTIFEKTHRDMRDWFYAINKIGINGRKGISSRELQRDIGGGKNATWRMLQQIRKAMGNIKDREAFSCIVEVDESYFGGKPRKENAQTGIDNQLIKTKKNKRGRGTKKNPAVGVRERNTGNVYIKVALPDKEGKKLTGKQLMKIISESTKPAITVITDDFRSYGILDKEDSKYIHLKVNHSEGEYCNSKHPWIHTNGIESVWAIAKRAYMGVYHHYTIEYMQRYMDEVAFRLSHINDDRTFDTILEQSIGAA